MQVGPRRSLRIFICHQYPITHAVTLEFQKEPSSLLPLVFFSPNGTSRINTLPETLTPLPPSRTAWQTSTSATSLSWAIMDAVAFKLRSLTSPPTSTEQERRSKLGSIRSEPYTTTQLGKSFIPPPLPPCSFGAEGGMEREHRN